MGKKACWLTIIVCLVVDVFIMLHFHNWCANASRTSILWLDGAVHAYSFAYFLGFITCCMASVPAIIAITELTYKPRKKAKK